MAVARCLFLASLMIAALTLLGGCVEGPAPHVEAARDTCRIVLDLGARPRAVFVHNAAPVCAR